MSKDKKDDDKTKKGGKGLIVKLGSGLGLLAAGGGGAFAMIQSGMLPGAAEHHKEDNSPKLIKKGEEDPYAPASGDKEGEAAHDVYGDGGSEYRTLYYSFADDFTSNLKDSSALVQVSLAASTRRDGRVIMWLKKHELAIRSSMLAVLADTTEEQVMTVEGKTRLQKRLTDAINKVLVEHEGFGGVDNVYFRSFIIQ